MHVLHSHFRLNFAANITPNQEPQQLINAGGQRTQIVQQAWALLWKSAPLKSQMGKRGSAGNLILHPFCTGYNCTVVCKFLHQYYNCYLPEPLFFFGQGVTNITPLEKGLVELYGQFHNWKRCIQANFHIWFYYCIIIYWFQVTIMLQYVHPP